METRERFVLKLHDVDPYDIEPNGDRYVVEVVDIDESKVLFGSLLVITQTKTEDPRDPGAEPTVERRGVIAGVVLRAGNGHLLGLPDHPAHKLDDDSWERDSADVEMFYTPGDVVLIDHTAKGRALKILGRECRIVNQIDVLARINGIKLVPTETGWEEESRVAY